MDELRCDKHILLFVSILHAALDKSCIIISIHIIIILW